AAIDQVFVAGVGLFGAARSAARSAAAADRLQENPVGEVALGEDVAFVDEGDRAAIAARAALTAEIEIGVGSGAAIAAATADRLAEKGMRALAQRMDETRVRQAHRAAVAARRFAGQRRPADADGDLARFALVGGI